jgi:hypothetical protein
VRTTNTKETTMKTRTTSQTTNLFGVYEYGRLLATFATREEAQAVKANRDATLPATVSEFGREVAADRRVEYMG